MSINGMEELVFYNPWWTGAFNKSQVKEYRREMFGTVLQYLEKANRIIIIKGPRRVGKTTLLYQLIAHLLDRGTDPTTILYVSFDDPKLRRDFDAILDFYKTEILRGPLEGREIYVFLDEVQFLDNWQYFLKKYYDRHFPLKFVVSGSSATLIKKGSESLMGRTIEEVLLPFSFREFFAYKTGVKPEPIDLERPGLLAVKRYEERAKILFSEYLETGGFPHLFETDKSLHQKLIREDIVEKALYRDIVALYGVKKPELLEKLFIYLVNSTAQLVNQSTLSRRLGLSRPYVSKYLLYLKHAYFLIAFRNYSTSAGKAARSGEKVYAIDPALIRTFLSGEFAHETGHLVESIVARHLFGKRVYYWKNYREVDFIVKEKEVMPIEVKYKNQYTEKDLSGLLEFSRIYGCRKGLLLTKDLFETISRGEMTIFLRPLWLYVLSL